MVKVQICSATSMVQLSFYEATRILFVIKKNLMHLFCNMQYLFLLIYLALIL